MPEQPQAEIRKRMLFMCAFLGVLVGLGAYLAFKAVQQENYALFAILPALGLSAIPMLRSLVRLKRQQQSVD